MNRQIPQPCYGSYTERHKRRLVKKENEKSAKRVKLLIDKILEKKNCDTCNSVQAESFDVQSSYAIKHESIIHTHNLEIKINESDLTPVLNNAEICNVTENNEKYNDLEFDETDDEIILKDEEVEYRYSDCENSDEEDNEDFANKPTIADSNEDVCKVISSQLKHVLAQWSVQCNIPKSAQKKFLQYVRNEIPMLNLPLDPRTIVKVPRYGEIHQIKGGEYCHFGLKSILEKIIHQRSVENINNKIDLLINIDGAPLGKDSVKNLWPILTSDTKSKKVYIIGVFCGKSKPEDVDEFLKLFVEEATYLINNGFCKDGIQYTISIDGLIFDAPAKAYILGVKSHSGYFSCTKCEIKGIYRDCVCFPGKPGTLRTDEKFAAFDIYKKQGYQLKQTIVNTIPKLGLVTQVPLDSMHLVFVGCTRKFFLIWRFSSTKYKLPIIKINMISNNFIRISPFVPYEFARKPRSLDDIKKFKATELRQILLYTGVVALKGDVSDNVYDNFVTLHVIISICSNPKLCYIPQWVDYAEKLGKIFVNEFKNLYGSKSVSHNVHNVQHLADDVRKYGELENFSAFRFENFIGRMKRLLRSGNNVSQQLINRCSEIEILQETPPYAIRSANLKQPHNVGPVPKDLKNVLQYKFLEFDSFKINCDDGKNNYVYVDNANVVKVSNVIKSNSNIYIVGRTLKIIGPLYERPCLSSKLSINVVSSQEQNTPLQHWSINNITAKLFIIPYKENIVAFPIVHTIRSPL